MWWGTLPPRWGLGFTQRTQKLYDADKVEKEAAEFERRGYPLDFIGLEPGWQSKAYPCSFRWDKGRFPEPEAFVGRMREKGYVSTCGQIRMYLPLRAFIRIYIHIPVLIPFGAESYLTGEWSRHAVSGWINWNRNISA